jgi:heme exporter protein C
MAMDERFKKRAAAGMSPWKWLLLPGMSAVILMAYLWAGSLPAFQSPQSARIIFWHVPMAILSMVWFFIAAFYAGRYLYGKRQDAFDDDRASKAAEVGLLLTVLATVTGAIFSKMQWAGGLNSPWYEGYWQWDPKQTAIVVVIFIFMAYFALRMSIEDKTTRARVSSVYAVLGAIAVPFLYYTLPHLPVFQSLHPTDVIKQGMDAPYRTTFWLATLMFFGISFWAYELQLRLARLPERRPVPDGADEARFEAVRRTVTEA